jgi:hypothetical protein
MKFNMRAAVLIFALLAIVITIYPPFNWQIIPSGHDSPLTLTPVSFELRTHEFLWSDDYKKMTVVGWEWDGQKSSPVAGWLYRTLDKERIKTYYFLAALIAVVVGVLVRGKPK